jgi:hypothetical protein
MGCFGMVSFFERNSKCGAMISYQTMHYIYEAYISMYDVQTIATRGTSSSFSLTAKWNEGDVVIALFAAANSSLHIDAPLFTLTTTSIHQREHHHQHQQLHLLFCFHGRERNILTTQTTSIGFFFSIPSSSSIVVCFRLLSLHHHDATTKQQQP